MAAIIFILLFVSMHHVSTDSLLGCDSAEKENDMIIDTVLSQQNATTLKFITNYHASSPEDCFEDCCRTDSCNIATFRYAKSELISERNCVHMICLPLDVCVYRESNQTIIAKLYRSDNKTDIEDISKNTEFYLEDRSKNTELNLTDSEYADDDVFYHPNISENVTQKIIPEIVTQKVISENVTQKTISENVTQNVISENVTRKVVSDKSTVLVLDQNLENSSDIETQLQVNTSVVPDLKNLENIFSKFTRINSPVSIDVSSTVNYFSSEQLGSKPSVKKQLQTLPHWKNSLTTSKEDVTQTGGHLKLELPQVDASILLPITPKIIPLPSEDAISFRRPLNQSDSSKKGHTNNFIRTKKELSEKILLIIVASMGVATVVIVAVLIGRHFHDTWQRRHYSKMDYLVDGMYNWNDDKE